LLAELAFKHKERVRAGTFSVAWLTFLHSSCTYGFLK